MNKKKNAQSQQNTPEKANQLDSTPYDMHYTVNIKKGILSKDLNDSQEQIGGDSVETEKLSSNSSLTQPDNNYDITIEQSFNNICRTSELLSPQSLQNLEKKFNNTKQTPNKVPVISKFQLNKDTFDLDWIEDLYKPKKPKQSWTAKKSNQNYIKQNIQTVKEIKIRKQPFSTSVKKSNNSKNDQELDKVDLSILTKKNEVNNQFQLSKVEEYTLSPQITFENKKSRRSFEQFIREQHKFVCEKEEKLNHKRAQYQEMEEKAIREQVKANNIKGTLKQQKQIVDRLYHASFLQRVQTQQQNPKKKREIKNYYLESDFSYHKSYHYEELNKQQCQQIEITKNKKEKSKHSDEYFLKKLQVSLKQWFNQNKLIDKESFTEFLVKHHFIKEQEEKNLSIEIFQAIQKDNQVPLQGALPFLATALGIYGKIASEKNQSRYG